MTWFEDLTPYTYLRGEPTNPPTLNVGWLSREHELTKGNVPDRFVSRLGELREHARTRDTRGLFPCEFCPDLRTREGYEAAERVRLSSCEIRAVGADGTRYAAPSLVFHYVAAHGYAPPQVFIDAVLRMESLTWEYAEANHLCMSCGTELVHDRATAARLAIPTLPCFTCAGCATTYWR